MSAPKSERIVALDVMRGATIALMILVNNPGNWGFIFAPFRHADWNGCTPTDLVFPFFLFIMGVSGYISLSKTPQLTWSVGRKIVYRFVLMFAIGLGLNLCFKLLGALIYHGESLSQIGREIAESLRIWGVLQRLAISYLFGSLIAVIVPLRHLWRVIVPLLVANSALLFFGNGYEYSVDSIANTLDRWVFSVAHAHSEILNDPSHIFIDPEGCIGVLSSIAHYLLGILCGSLLLSKDNIEVKVNRLSVFGTALLFAGLLLSYGEPINKNLWSSTYVLLTSGLATLTLSMLVWIVDIRGGRSWIRPFLAFGVNPLFLYVLSQLLDMMVSFIRVGAFADSPTIKEHIYRCIVHLIGNMELASLIYAMLIVGTCWIAAKILHNRDIVIKI